VLIAVPEKTKSQVTKPFESDIVDYFRKQGRGWQGRMSSVLRAFVDNHQ
jgi:uncharacterized protein (DUF4415 family)